MNDFAYQAEPLRGQILATAARLTTNDRNKTYGTPVNNMAANAVLIEAYLEAKRLQKGGPTPISAEDAAAFMVLAKLARTFVTYHEDNYIDAAAYIAMMAECSGSEARK